MDVVSLTAVNTAEYGIIGASGKKNVCSLGRFTVPNCPWSSKFWKLLGDWIILILQSLDSHLKEYWIINPVNPAGLARLWIQTPWYVV